MALAEDTLDALRTAGLAEIDPEIAALLGAELERQRNQIELIASENFTWPSVLEAVGSVPTNKYAEGYPGKRYYGGCEIVDQIEQLAIDRAKDAVRCRARERPASCRRAGEHGGVPRADAAGRHGAVAPARSRRPPHARPQGQLLRAALHDRPLRRLPGDEPRRLRRGARAREGASAEGDPLRRLGLSAHRRDVGVPQDRRRGRSAARGATWRTSRGSSRPACIRTRWTTATSSPRRRTRRSPARARDSSSAARSTRRRSTAPSSRASRAGRSSTRSPRRRRASGSPPRRRSASYQTQVRANADALAAEIIAGGLDVLTGGTDTHLLQLDLRRTEWTGKDAEERLHAVKLTTNRNTVPFDERPPTIASGVRIGTPAATMRGFDEDDFREVGQDHRRRARRRGRRPGSRRAQRGALRAAAALPGLPRVHEVLRRERPRSSRSIIRSSATSSASCATSRRRRRCSVSSSTS